MVRIVGDLQINPCEMDDYSVVGCSHFLPFFDEAKNKHKHLVKRRCVDHFGINKFDFSDFQFCHYFDNQSMLF